MPRMKFNVYVFITAIISVTAMLMAALTFVLLPQSGEVMGIMQWRMMRASAFRMDAKVRYVGRYDHRDENYVRRNDTESFAADVAGAVMRAQGNDKGGAGLTFDIVVGEQPGAVAVDGEYRRIAGADFLKFGSLPERLGAIELGEYADRWLRFALDDIRGSLDVPLFGSRGEEMTDDDRVALLLLFRRTPFLTFERKLGTDSIGGEKVNHYAVTPEVLFFKDYFVRSETVRLGRELTSDERLAVDTFFANVSAETGELWIGRTDYYLYRIRLRFRYDDGARDGALDITADFSDFDVRANVPSPEGDVLEIGEIIGSLLPTITRHLPLAGEGAVRRGGDRSKKSLGLPIDAQVLAKGDTDEDGLSNALESFYRSDPTNADTDGDGVSDGDEIEKGLDPNGPGKLFDFGVTEGR